MTDAQAQDSCQDAIRDIVTGLIAMVDACDAARQAMPIDDVIAGVMKATSQVDPFLLREVSTVLHGVCSGSPAPSPMKRLIARLLSEAPALGADGKASQTPAMDCVVLLAGSGQAFRGSLSTTPEGTLRLLGPGHDGHKQVLVEQFFSYASVVSLGVMREMQVERSSILSSFDTTS
jgi:hypothetical protein